MIHPWHQISIDHLQEGIVRCLIEIPKGGKLKYELDKETGLLKLDRVLYSSVQYPVNYGMIPQTMDGDGDPLDILVICQEPIQPMALVEAKIIGVMDMRDNGQKDRKILAVALNDMAVNYVNEIDQLPPHSTVEIKKFFEDYKVLENKTVVIEKFLDRSQALQVLEECKENYKKAFQKQS
jgi:inorganic pyrophosphatase